MPQPFSTLFAPGPLSVEVDGRPVVNLTGDLISYQYQENLAQCLLLEVSVNNWGPNNNTVGYTYSGRADGGDLVSLGAPVRLYCAEFTLAAGKITTLAPCFSQSGPPTLRFLVDAERPLQRLSTVALSLAYGAELDEFYPVLHPNAILEQQKIQATGSTQGLPSLRAGVKLTINGVGTLCSGEYAVTETTHTFDRASGYRTSFACERLLPRAAG